MATYSGPQCHSNNHTAPTVLMCGSIKGSKLIQGGSRIFPEVNLSKTLCVESEAWCETLSGWL